MAIVGVQKCVDGQDGLQNGFQEVAHTVQNGAEMGQDAAKTRENESKKCGHSRQIRCFRKECTYETGIGQSSNRPTGNKRPNVAIVGVKKGAGGQDGFQNGFQEVAKTVQDGAKMRPRHEKMSPINAAIAARFAVFAKLGQFRGKEGPIMHL